MLTFEEEKREICYRILWNICLGCVDGEVWVPPFSQMIMPNNIGFLVFYFF